MTAIRLRKLPDRTPVKLSIHVAPELNEALAQYAAFYQEHYGSAESVSDLVLAMLAAFLESDRAFVQRRKAGVK